MENCISGRVRRACSGPDVKKVLGAYPYFCCDFDCDCSCVSLEIEKDKRLKVLLD
jgi:hypothetical protein